LQRTHQLRREEAIREIVDSLDGTEAVISTTGKASRELFEYRILKGQSPRDFYTVGSMGCSPSIALAIALQKPEKKIIVLDGDGAALMQLGTMATIGNYSPKNLCHIILDNGSYESTGGQPTVSNTVDFEKVAIACGYKFAETVKTKVDLKNAMEKIKWDGGPKMLVVKVNKGSRENLGRPTTSPNDNKEEFIRHLES
jgi:phosphonopyruvate decarboxylase